MDKAVSTLIARGVPGLVLLVAISKTGLAGGAAVSAALAGLGPGGMVAGVMVLLTLSLVAKAIADYGVEAIFRQVIKGLLNKGETKYSIRTKVSSYPISKSLKLALFDYLKRC